MTTTHTPHPHRCGSSPDTDRGTTLLDLLVMVAIMASIIGAAIFAFSAVNVEASGGCAADERRLEAVVEWYLAERSTDTIPATGRGHDRFERTLVDEQFLQSPSTFHDLDATGAVTPQENTSC